MIPIDDRSLLTGATPDNLERIASRWPVPKEASTNLTSLLERSRRLFLGSAATYENLGPALLVGFQACESALRDVTGTPTVDKVTMGPLVERAMDASLLSTAEHLWLHEFVLHFRNRLSHPDRAITLTPGIVAPALGQIHVFIEGLYRYLPTAQERQLGPAASFWGRFGQ